MVVEPGQVFFMDASGAPRNFLRAGFGGNGTYAIAPADAQAHLRNGLAMGANRLLPGWGGQGITLGLFVAVGLWGHNRLRHEVRQIVRSTRSTSARVPIGSRMLVRPA